MGPLRVINPTHQSMRHRVDALSLRVHALSLRVDALSHNYISLPSKANFDDTFVFNNALNTLYGQ